MPEYLSDTPASQENHHPEALQRMGAFVASLANQRHTLHRAAGASVATFAIGLFASGETAMADTTPVSPDDAALTALTPPEVAPMEQYRDLESLPGKDIKVSEKSINRLKNSTVRVVKGLYSDKNRTKPFGRWEDVCTGVKILVKGKPFISTAAHCFSDRTGSADGLLDAEDYEGNPWALDFGKIPQRMDVAIIDPKQKVRERGQIGSASSILVSVRHKDTALLKIRPHPAHRRAKARAYDKVPALQFSNATSKLVPGQEMGMFGLSSANKNMPVMGKGTFLGFYEDVNGTNQLVVGVNTTQRRNDPCSFGISGGRVVGDIVNGNGKVVKRVMSGPLSMRLNATYDAIRNDPTQPINSPKVVKQKQDRVKYGVSLLERGLNLKLQDEFDTYCVYTTESDQTVETLASAIGKYPQSTTTSKDSSR